MISPCKKTVSVDRYGFFKKKTSHSRLPATVTKGGDDFLAGGCFCVLEVGLEGLMFSFRLSALDFVVDFGWGLLFGVHEIVFS